MIDPERDEMLEKLAGGDRSSFLPALADLLDARPDADALKRFAEKSPDRYWQAVIMAMKAAGFRDQVDVNVRGGLHQLVAELHALPDSELQARLRTALEEQHSIKAIPVTSYITSISSASASTTAVPDVPDIPVAPPTSVAPSPLPPSAKPGVEDAA